MANSALGSIRKVTPSDTVELKDFNYIQAGVSGTVAVQFEGGDVVNLSQEIIDKMALLPIGTMNRVLATGTTATDIYVW
tara:strand:- start:5728 stop:5964 length:237 start_codon:yes stop_codon:yes gene_type:complete